MKNFKRVLGILLLAIMILGLVSCTSSCYKHVTYENTIEYKLQEIGDGVYGYYNVVTSNIPAENYEVIVLCFANSIYTLNGDVNVHYIDSNDEARLIWTDVNVVHGDTFYVYVPYGSIEIRPNLVQS